LYPAIYQFTHFNFHLFSNYTKLFHQNQPSQTKTVNMQFSAAAIFAVLASVAAAQQV
jgi:hypothetical protein